MEACQDCWFGYTSSRGTTSMTECVKTRLACPENQIAPPDAVSAAQCVCRPGYGGKPTDGVVNLEPEGTTVIEQGSPRA